MEIVSDILGALNMKAGDLTLEAGFFIAAFLMLAGAILLLQSGHTNAGSAIISAGVVFAMTLFFFVQRDKSGNSFGAINAIVPLLLTTAGALTGLILRKQLSKPGTLKWLNIFNMVAGSIAVLICITGFARTHHNAILISAFGVSFGLVSVAATVVMLRKKPEKWARTSFIQSGSLPFFSLFLASMSISLTGYIVVSTPMILTAVTLAALGLSVSIKQCSEDDCSLMVFLRKQVGDDPKKVIKKDD